LIPASDLLVRIANRTDDLDARIGTMENIPVARRRVLIASVHQHFQLTALKSWRMGYRFRRNDAAWDTVTVVLDVNPAVVRRFWGFISCLHYCCETNQSRQNGRHRKAELIPNHMHVHSPETVANGHRRSMSFCPEGGRSPDDEVSTHY
jgi:hypothetical protein